jgi:hypothetical protein
MVDLFRSKSEPKKKTPKVVKNTRTAKTGRNNNNNSLDWLEESVLIPRPGTPAVDHTNRIAKRMRIAIVASLVLGFIAMIGLITSVEGSKKPTGGGGHTQLTSKGRNVATTTIQAWLAEVPSPLPGGQILSWDGAKTIKGANGKVELDTFTLETPLAATATSPTGLQDKYYEATVEIDLNGLVPIGGPGLQPINGTSGSTNTLSPWPTVSSGAITTSVTPAVTQAITGWLDAYVSGSSSQLAVAVGDPDTSHHYRALQGVASANFSVLYAAPREAPNVAPAPNNSSPDALLVEVSLNIQWNGEKALAPNTSVDGPPTTTDLLIERANTAAPVVVAWGQPGTGPSLKPYGNG